jgi:cell division protein FtsW (lipid II flippase)
MEEKSELNALPKNQEIDSSVKSFLKENNSQSHKAPSVSVYQNFSWLFMIVAVGCTIYGIRTVYSDDYSSKIVGGDAYNFIIYATRGTVWVCVGIVNAVIGLTFAMFANTSKNS